jgi:hypothetical protein
MIDKTQELAGIRKMSDLELEFVAGGAGKPPQGGGNDDADSDSDSSSDSDSGNGGGGGGGGDIIIIR